MRGLVHIGPDTAGFASSLQGLLAHAGTPLAIVGEPSPFAYGGNIQHLRFADRIKNILLRVPLRGPRARRLMKGLIQVVRVLEIAFRFRIIIVGSAKSVTRSSWEWRLYQAVRCRIVVMLHGSEARPHFLNGAYPHPESSIDLLRNMNAQRAWLEVVERYADTIVGSPGVLHYLRRPIVDRDVIGWPVDPGVFPDPPAADWKTPTARRKSPMAHHSIRILHAPSNPRAKGTSRITEMISNLQSEGSLIDFRILHEVPSEAVRRALGWCDIVIDQMYADVPGGIFALEALLAGKPVIVGSAFAEWLDKRYSESRAMPILCHPDEVQSHIRRLVQSTDELERDTTIAGGCGSTSVSGRG